MHFVGGVGIYKTKTRKGLNVYQSSDGLPSPGNEVCPTPIKGHVTVISTKSQNFHYVSLFRGQGTHTKIHRECSKRETFKPSRLLPKGKTEKSHAAKKEGAMQSHMLHLHMRRLRAATEAHTPTPRSFPQTILVLPRCMHRVFTHHIAHVIRNKDTTSHGRHATPQ